MNKSDGITIHCWDRRAGWAAVLGDGLPQELKRMLERPVTGLVVYCIVMLLVYLLLEQLLGALLAVPFTAYSETSIALSAVKSFGWTARILLVVFAVVLLMLDPAKLRWSEFSGGTGLRVAVTVMAAAMAWPFITYGYNYALDAGHLIDRSMLFALLLLLIWRPVFIVPFLVVAYAILGQLVAPSLGGSVLPHKTQVLRALEVFAAFYFVRVATGYHRTGGFLFMLGCFVSVAYVLPAWAKFQIDWLAGDHLEFVPISAYAHGWRGLQSPESIVTFVQNLELFAPFLKVGVFVLEAAFLFFFFRLRMAIVLLFGAIAFHIGVFYLFGFLFWTWIALDLVLIGLLFYFRHALSGSDLFGLKTLPLSIGLIALGHFWAKPPLLGWYETPLAYSYTVNATLDDGRSLRLNPRFFAPYEDAFTMTGFGYLAKAHGVLVGPYGATHDDAVHAQLANATSADRVFELERKLATIGYNEARASRTYEFIEQFIRARNAQGDRYQWLYSLHSPRQFWSNEGGLTELGDHKIRSATIVEKTYFFNGKTLDVIREIPLHTIDLSPTH